MRNIVKIRAIRCHLVQTNSHSANINCNQIKKAKIFQKTTTQMTSMLESDWYRMLQRVISRYHRGRITILPKHNSYKVLSIKINSKMLKTMKKFWQLFKVVQTKTEKTFSKQQASTNLHQQISNEKDSIIS